MSGRVPYDQGVPFAQPDVRTPDDYQREEASPADFGGQIAKGLDTLGAGETKASQFFSQIATQQAVQNWQD
jgi:hypothetical protein